MVGEYLVKIRCASSPPLHGDVATQNLASASRCPAAMLSAVAGLAALVETRWCVQHTSNRVLSSPECEPSMGCPGRTAPAASMAPRLALAHF